MATLNAEEIKKIKKGERAGYAAAGVCCADLLFFIVCFTLAQVYDLYILRLCTLIIAPVIMVAAVAVSAYCNLAFSRKAERLTSEYIQDVLVENAALMHPERPSLTFYILIDGNTAELTVNNFKEKTVFDFSAFGKLTAVRRSAIISALVTKLGHTFCRLAERGAKYTAVAYKISTPKKEGKTTYIMIDGAPDKKLYKNYLKTK